ncbi:tetratricopeptide repeat protein (plasmid) [Streptomyces sp. NBC_01527]|uniref:AfsR/SARP family transcriptional regulator n=1 Tax=unclassified Streptomyces TaxID=2593676 RepID=UPI002E11DF27|nr:tetratricopeptide repeat protein [Streptomyces sp. NBC_01230]
MRFQILGPVRVWRDTADVRLGPPKQRALLALLLAHAGQPVPLHGIVDALWHEDPPATAVNVVHRHVAALRRVLEPELLSGTASRRLVRDSGGYRLEVAPDELDLLRFRMLREDSHRSAQQGDRVKAVELLVEALDLWRGPAASGIPPEIRALPVFTAVDDEHVVVVKEAAGFVPTAGAMLTERVLVTIRRTASHHPFDEGLQARLIEVLAAAGRQAEALETYQVVRERIADEIGLDPGPELRKAQHSALNQTDPPRTPAPSGSAVGPGPDGAAVTDLVRPAQLPRGLGAFTGRCSELDVLDTLVPGSVDPAQAIVISGMAGVGKTTLAVHWANGLAGRFPDGQLYVDLRGFHLTGAAMSGAEALRGLLDAFGVPVGRIPAGLQAQAVLYRSLLADRRVMVVLDNARDSEQVRPLLPAPPGCLAVVTSRHQLQGLMAVEGARSVTLGPLDEDEAVTLLTRRLGGERVARETSAAAEIVSLCGRLPLALAIVSARAALNPGYPLAAIADELRASHGSLDAFTGEPPLADARCIFSWSYRALTPEAARLFRLLALHPGPDCSVDAAASLAATHARQVRPHLAELVRAHLLFENEPGRFSSHSLLRAYATELVVELETPQEAEAATTRVLDHYLHSAHAAEAVLAPHRERITLRRPAAHTSPELFPDQRAAADWFDRERSVLLAAVEQDGRHGDGTFSWQLAAALELYLDRNGRWQQQRAVQSTAISAAQRGGDLLGQAHGHRALGFALSRLEQWEGAGEHLECALQLFRELGDTHGQARVHRYGAFVANQHGQHTDALDHYRLASELYRSVGYLNGEASVHNEVGWTYLLLGEYDKVLDECSRALAIHQETGDHNGEAAAWDSLGCAFHQLDHHDQALGSFRRALRIYRKIRDTYLEADTLVHIADTHLAAGRTGEAADTLRQALYILEGIGHPDAEGVRGGLLKLGVNPVVPQDRV